MFPLSAPAESLRVVLHWLWRPVWRMYRKIRPHRIATLREFVPAGCRMEIATNMELAYANGNDRVREGDYARAIIGEIHPGDTVFDIGAAVGFYACHAGLRGARVFAFEPDPLMLHRLTRNTALNHLQATVSILGWAISDQDGTTLLYTPGVEGFTPTLLPRGEDQPLSVECHSLDAAVASGLVPVPTVVKLDIEGAEILALRGMRALLSAPTGPRVVFIELHPCGLEGLGSTPEECRALLEECGYTCTSEDSPSIKEWQCNCVYRKQAASPPAAAATAS